MLSVEREMMMRRIGMIAAAVLVLAAFVFAEMKGAEQASMEKSNITKGKNGLVSPGLRLTEKEIQSWRDMKFGMFIHWGLYAIPARGEWVMNNEKIPAPEYARLAEQFNPQRFDADAWAQVARDAGMKYMVLTARHPDGFSLWNSPSSYGDFTSVKTAAKRDFVKEYVKACRKAGLKVGIYYSLMDWRFPGYFNPDGLPDNAQLMKKQCWGQVEELCSHYGKIDILWYDGGWLAHQGTDADGARLWDSVRLNDMVRHYNRKTVINPRSGWEGDFRCNEGDARVTGPIDPLPWEKCLNLNRSSWGYNTKQNLMGFEEVIGMVLDVVVRNGNVLLNVGPDADGVIPASHVERLRQVGVWMKDYGDSIYATRGGPFEPTEFYGSTYRGKTIYIHARQWPADGKINLPAIGQKIKASSLLRGGKVSVEQTGDGIMISVLPVDRGLLDTVVVLELDKPVTGLMAK
jgi:alpha-L-fucosidase